MSQRDGYENGMKRFLPSLEGAYESFREFTLIGFMMFTLMSLAIFWGELAAYHDIPAESVTVIGWAFDILAAMMVIWVALRVAVLVNRIPRGEKA